MAPARLSRATRIQRRHWFLAAAVVVVVGPPAAAFVAARCGSVAASLRGPAAAQSPLFRTARAATSPLKDVMPPVGYGLGTAWYKSTGDEAVAAMRSGVQNALEAGFLHIDEAELYENEMHTGEPIQEFLSSTGMPREKLWITGKVYNVDEGIDAVCTRSLERLGLEYFDLYLIHSTISLDGTKFEKSLEQMWAEMEGLVTSGKAKYIGVSNFRVSDLEQIYDGAKIKPVCNQVEAHPYLQQRGLVSYCEDKGIMVPAYTPLASLKGDFKGGPVDEVVEEISTRLGITPAQVLLRWNLQRSPLSAVITTTSKKERLKEFLAVPELPPLSAEDVEAISAAGMKEQKRVHWGDAGIFAKDPSTEPDSKILQAA